MGQLSISPKKSCAEISVRILKSSISCLRNGLCFPDLSSDAHPVLFDFRERLYGIVLAFDSDSAGINARFLQHSRNACHPQFREFQVEGLRSRSSVGIADDSTFASKLAFRNSANAVIFSCSEVRICAEPMLNKIFLRRAAGFSVLFVSGVCIGAGRVPCTAGSSFSAGSVVQAGVTGAAATAGCDFL